MIKKIVSTALLGCFVLYAQGQQVLDPQTVQSNLRRLVETKLDAQGHQVDPASMKDKMVLLAFSGDPNDEALTMFRKTMPVVKTKVDGVAVIRVSNLPEGTQTTREAWRNSLDEFDHKLIQLLDNDNIMQFSAAKAYGVTEYPTSFLFDADGKLLRKFTGRTLDAVMNIFSETSKLALSGNYQQEMEQIKVALQQHKEFLSADVSAKETLLKGLKLDNPYQVQLEDKMRAALAVDYAKANKITELNTSLTSIKDLQLKWAAVAEAAEVLKSTKQVQAGAQLLQGALDEIRSLSESGTLKLDYLNAYSKLAETYVQLVPLQGNEPSYIKYLEPIYATAQFFPSDLHTVLHDDARHVTKPQLKDLLTYHYAKAVAHAGQVNEVAQVWASYLHAEPDIKKRSQEVNKEFAQVKGFAAALTAITPTGLEANYQIIYKIMLRPDFDGKVIGLHNVKGKYIIFDYWASWCGPCRASHPFLKEMYTQYKDKGLEMVGIAAEHSTDQNMRLFNGKRAVREDGTPWIQLMEEQENISQFFPYHGAGGSLVKKIIFDKTGKLYGVFEGKDKEGLKAKLAELMP